MHNKLWLRWRNTQKKSLQELCSIAWSFFWMQFAGLGVLGRMTTWVATWFAPPYKERRRLARYHRNGYIAPSATIHHAERQFGANIFIGDRVLVFQDHEGGLVELGDRVHLHQDTCLQTGKDGSLNIGADTHVQPRCLFSAYKAPITVGCGVQIAPNCAFYSYAHGIAPGEPIQQQPLQTKGGIIIDDDAWIGHGVIVLDGVRIGKGAVVGAGAVVTKDIPDGAIAAGSPARVIKQRRLEQPKQPSLL